MVKLPPSNPPPAYVWYFFAIWYWPEKKLNPKFCVAILMKMKKFLQKLKLNPQNSPLDTLCRKHTLHQTLSWNIQHLLNPTTFLASSVIRIVKTQDLSTQDAPRKKETQRFLYYYRATLFCSVRRDENKFLPDLCPKPSWLTAYWFY